MTTTINPGRYRGLSYEQASREGLRLTLEAGKRQNWCSYLDALVQLREIMNVTRPHADAPGP